MLERLEHISPKTKILFVATLFILLPSAILSYLGLRSVHERAENLRTNYTGTINLIRDKIEHEVLRLEDNLRLVLRETPAEPQTKQDLINWFSRIKSNTQGITHPFLANLSEGLISTSVASGWWKPRKSLELDRLYHSAEFQTAEVSEFVERDFARAIERYKIALLNSSFAIQKAALLSRIGRCYFKLGKYTEGIAEYKKILLLPDQKDNHATLPHSIAALSQISEGYSSMKMEKEKATALLRLYERLIDDPWDLAGGDFTFYLNSVRNDLEDYVRSHSSDTTASRTFLELQKRESFLDEEIGFIELVRQNILPQIQMARWRGSLSEMQPRYSSERFHDSAVQIGYLMLPSSFRQSHIVSFGFEIDKQYLIVDLLPRILSTIDLGKDVVVGIVDEKAEIQYPRDRSGIWDHLVAENFSQIFPSWKVALFHREGKTIDALVEKDKQIYLGLFVGIMLVMLVGMVITVRAASHELEVSRMKAEFVSNVTHELKTPLALIRMFGETLETGLVTDEAKRHEFYQIIRKESERLTHLINNVLDFSKMDAGIKEYTFEEADLAEVVRSTLEAYKFHIREVGFEMVSEIPAEPMIATVDKDAISQAILNLLSNATKYSKDEKYIGVVLRKNSTDVILSVEDRGVGIPKEELPKIFEKFYRVGTAKTRETRGSGLGLALVKHIVKAHGGEVEISSEVGRGSTFTITIPLEQEGRGR